MTQDTNPTTEATSLDEIATRTRQLAQAVIDRKIRTGWLIEDGHELRHWLDLGRSSWAKPGALAMSYTGKLIIRRRSPARNVGEEWRTISNGLERAMCWNHHTHPIQGVDPDDIAEHIIDTARAWILANVPRHEIPAVMANIERYQERFPKLPLTLTALNVAAHHLSTEMEMIRATIESKAIISPRLSAALDVMSGAQQAISVAKSLLSFPTVSGCADPVEPSAALCPEGVKSPPEGTDPACSFLT